MRAANIHSTGRRPLETRRKRRGPVPPFAPVLLASAALVALAASTLVTWFQPRAAHRIVNYVPLGAFLGSGAEGVARVERFQRWLGSTVTVGRTYLPGDSWEDVEGPPQILQPWTRWREADPRRTLVVNVPMMAPNEAELPPAVLSSLLRGGAAGAFDDHYRTLARNLVAQNAGESVIVLGWEMNGDVYDGRCAPNPAAWKAYWRRIVTAMRAVPGARFRFDFAPNRGHDAIPWTDCYPGDDVVDIIGSDNYDQPPGDSFQAYIDQPYGMKAQADFAAAHGKPISFPEWGLFRNSDNAEYIQGMHDWMVSHNVAYQSITDYCPHGVWECGANPRSAQTYRELFGGVIVPSPGPADSGAAQPAGSPASTPPPSAPNPAPSAPNPEPSASNPEPSASSAAPSPAPASPAAPAAPANPPPVPPGSPARPAPDIARTSEPARTSAPRS
ncbi:glycoside hydrolase family 26 protein [Actinomadura opuntiae]|uniref:glycoside hydrolase family 26 protein n=1 Tax=Actinomadura sp. OS1-43 TaxID=604315 RepID=UPI00255A934D|nr:glycosyl hydrolase [Actinomadura sp. OS1-43]MDL4815371.1 glycosyl hydrolase [Actinomadura sp. OS1-43]